jgi:hypothetical protein
MASPAIPILFGGLIAWSIYRRVRRNIGRQKVRPVRSIISIVIISLVTVLLIAISAQFPNLLLALGGGILPGAALGFVGLRLTKFEVIEGKNFYTPNTYIGVALSLLFVGRMLYRFWSLHEVVAHNQPPLFQSPLTFFVFGLVAGYYLVFQTGVLRHARTAR